MFTERPGLNIPKEKPRWKTQVKKISDKLWISAKFGTSNKLWISDKLWISNRLRISDEYRISDELRISKPSGSEEIPGMSRSQHQESESLEWLGNGKHSTPLEK